MKGASVVFAIAEQSPGRVKFSVLVPNEQPHLVATNRAWRRDGELALEQTEPFGDWTDDGDQGAIGYVEFDVSEAIGLPCFAFIHRDNSRRELAAFSYVAP